jgi:peptidoglycan/LPS O-acetylase OafA/YrhL
MNEIGLSSGLKPHRGGMLLAFGILGILCCIVFGILAWVMGSSDLKEMAEGRMDPSGEGMTKAGKILGIIGCALAVLGIVVWVGLMVFGIAFAGMHRAL